MGIQNLVRIETHNNRVIELLQVGQEYLIDSRIVAKGLNLQHEYFKETLEKYQTRLERWGQLRFETGVVNGHNGGGNPQKFALLNRNQVLFAITLSRNTEEVLDWKEAIIDALDQLEKQVRSLAPQQKRLCIATPEDQKALILNKMRDLKSRGIKKISSAVMCGSYIKHIDKCRMHILMNELVEEKQLIKTYTRHATKGLYELV